MCLAHCGHDTYGCKVRVWRSQQRLECANLLALLLAARADPRRVGLRSRKDSGDKSPHSKRWRDCETTPCVDARSVRRAKQVPGTSSEDSEVTTGIMLSPLTRFAVVSSYFSPS